MASNEGWKNLIPPKKGEVRNPKGRGKGSKSIVKILKKLLDTDSTVPGENGETLSRAELIALNLIRKAESGKLKAIDSIIDRIDGKPVVTQVNVDSEKTYEEWLNSISDEDV